jgi:hypothetical protein
MNYLAVSRESFFGQVIEEKGQLYTAPNPKEPSPGKFHATGILPSTFVNPFRGG